MAVPDDLRALVGSWRGTYQLWLEPDAPARTCDTNATIDTTLDGRFLVYTYDWAFDGEPQHGIATLGRDGEGHYQMAWLDSWHNGDSIMFCTGDGPEPAVLGTYGPADGPWGWRTEFACDDADQFGVVAWNVTPDGSETKATEARYTRSA